MFNIIDLVVVVVLLYFIFRGYENGFLAGVLNLATTIFSLVSAILFYPMLADLIKEQFGISQNLANIISFFGILFILEASGAIITTLIYKFFALSFFRVRLLASFDKLLGVIPSALVGVFLLTIFLLLPVTLPYDFGLREPIQKSWVGQNILPTAYVLEPSLQTFLKRLPTQSLFFIITPSPVSKEISFLNFPKEINLKPSSNDEARMLELVNIERSKRGLKTLRLDASISQVARLHSQDMFVRGYFSHYNPEGLSAFERMDKGAVKFLAAGENLAYAPSVEIAHQGLMNSPGHKANILRSEFGRIGIGVIDGGIYGKMFTQNFAD